MTRDEIAIEAVNLPLLFVRHMRVPGDDIVWRHAFCFIDARAAGDRATEARAISNLGLVCFHRGELAAAKANVERALQALETGWLAERRFLTGDAVTIADMACYVELGQLQKEFTNVYDFGGVPNVSRWLADMHDVPGHDDVHVVLAEMGDISEEAPSMDRIKNANKQALSVLKTRLAEFAG